MVLIFFLENIAYRDIQDLRIFCKHLKGCLGNVYRVSSRNPFIPS